MERRPDTNTPPDEVSVFSRVMNSSVHDGGKSLPDPSKKVAILIVLANTDDADEIIGRISGALRESMDVQEFNPDYGSPVIYFP